MSNTYYGDYLCLEQILNAQHPRSEAAGRPAHDETLFIITHQTYELWFKQILHELSSALNLLQVPYVNDQDLNTVIHRLERIITIQHLLIQQIQVLETMHPLDFLDFRDLLVPASGFQSFQFRLLENRLGLPNEQRLRYNKSAYHESLSPQHQQLLTDAEQQPSLFAVIEAWLERTPFLQFGDFDFWQAYRQAVEQMFAQERQMIEQQPLFSEKEIEMHLRQLEKTAAEFQSLFTPEHYQQLRDKGQKRLSYKATQAALLIMLYRSRPILQLPYRLLNALTTIDENLTNWRYRHAQMVRRMIGAKQGTGGSLGYEYLLKTLESHRVFGDLEQLTTFLIPRSALPALPAEIESELGFAYQPEAQP